MENPFKKVPQEQDIFDYSPEVIAATTERIDEVVHRIGRAFIQVYNFNNQALLNVTDSLEEPRLTKYMADQLVPDEMYAPELLGILNTIDSKLPKKVFDEAERIMKETSRSSKPDSLSAAQKRALFLVGMAKTIDIGGTIKPLR